MNKNIISTLQEVRSFPPTPQFCARAQIKTKDLAALHYAAAQDPVGFWGELARRELVWHKPFTTTLDEAGAQLWMVY